MRELKPFTRETFYALHCLHSILWLCNTKSVFFLVFPPAMYSHPFAAFMPVIKDEANTCIAFRSCSLFDTSRRSLSRERVREQ